MVTLLSYKLIWNQFNLKNYNIPKHNRECKNSPLRFWQKQNWTQNTVITKINNYTEKNQDKNICMLLVLYVWEGETTEPKNQGRWQFQEQISF